MNQNATFDEGTAVLVMVLCGILLFALVLMVVARLLRARDDEYYTRPKTVCSACGAVAKPEIVAPGSPVTTVLLYLTAIVPGIFYSLWRQTHRKKVCSVCGSQDVVPPESPRGRELVAKYQPAR